MKKTRAFVIAVAIALGIGSTAYAKLPPKYIIIGNKGYHVNYISNHVRELNDVLTNNTVGGVYYVDDNSQIKSLFMGKDISESELKDKLKQNEITLINDIGERSVYQIDSGTEVMKSIADVQVQVTALPGSLKLVNIKVYDIKDNVLSKYDNKYFKVDDSGSTRKVLPKDTQGINQDDYQITLITPNVSENLSILTQDGNVIAHGSFDIPKPVNGATVDLKLSVEMKLVNGTESKQPNNGNLASNINHNGLVAQNNNVDIYGNKNNQDSWVYYSNTADGGKLYKKNLSGLEDYKISEDNAKYINVIGDWIYYSNYSDGGKIYKVKIDGTKRRKVCDDRASAINVAGDFIYYSNHSDRGKIYKVDRNARNLKSGGATKVSDDEALFMNVVGDNIFYSNASDKNKLYSIHIDGTYRTRLVDTPVKYVTFKDDFIYYVTEQGYLYKVMKNGSSMPQKINIKIDLTDKRGGNIRTVEDKVQGINIIGNNLYYWSRMDGGKIYKASALDSYDVKATKYADDRADSVNIININGNDEVYYTKAGKLFRCFDPVDSVDNKGNKTTKYSSVAVAKQKMDLKIVSYDKLVAPLEPIIAMVDNIEDYLPDKVTAVMSDNSTRELLVNWDTRKPMGKDGKISFKGVIVGYGQAVTLDTVNHSKTPNKDFITVKNNAGRNDDIVEVSKLAVGDIVKVYRDSLKTQLIGTATAVAATGDEGPAKATVVLQGDNVLADDAHLVYVTVTTPGLAESEVVEKDFSKAVASKDIDASQVKIRNIAENGVDTINIASGVGDAKLKKGDNIKVYKFENNTRVLLISQDVKGDNNPFENDRNYTCDIQLLGNIALGNESGKVLITRTSTDGAESNGIEVAYEKGDAPELAGYSESTISDMSGRKVSLTLNNIELPDANYKLYYKVSDTDAPETLKYGDMITGWTEYDSKTPTSTPINVLRKQYIHLVKTYNGKILSYGVRQAIVAEDDTLNSDKTPLSLETGTTTSAIKGNVISDIVGSKNLKLTYKLGEDYANGGTVVFKLPQSWVLSAGKVTASLNNSPISKINVSGSEITVTLENGAKADSDVSLNFNQDIQDPSIFTFYAKGNALKDAQNKDLSYSRICEVQLNIYNVKPTVTLEMGNDVGTTKVKGLDSKKQYEYVISQDASIKEDDNLWQKPNVVSSKDQIDNIKVSAGQYIHIREKAVPSQTPASDIADIQVTDAVIKK